MVFFQREMWSHLNFGWDTLPAFWI